MAEDRVVWAARQIYADADISVHLGFDAGDWTLETRGRVMHKPVTGRCVLSPAAMDALIAGWPGFRAEVGN